MRKGSIRLVCACHVALLLSIAGCGDDDSTPPPAGDAGPGDEFTQRLTADLESSGFLVSQGSTILYRAEDCETFTYPLTTNCWLNNPAAPYVAVTVKPWPDEYLDPAIADVMGQVVPGLTGVFRLDPREAIVVFGRLPPPGKYFGLQTWVFSQEGRWNQEAYDFWARMQDLVFPIQYLFDTIPADDPSSTRIQSLSSLSNVINNVVIERQSGGAFGELRYFIITPDATMDTAVRSALANLGVSDRDTFTEQIPQRDMFGSIGPIGLGREANDFTTFLRYAVPSDPVAGDAWRNERPLTVLRVRAQEGTPMPYPLLTFDPRTAVDEVGDVRLTSDFASLIESVCERARGEPWNLEVSGCGAQPPESLAFKEIVRDYGWTGPYCRSIGMDCLGDQQESALFFSQPQPLDDGQIYAVIGTLATTTGNATYSALSVNSFSLFKGAANVLDNLLAGSANAYAPTVANPDKFFVWYFARDCEAIARLTDGNCTAITPDMVPLRGDTTAPGDPSLHGTFDVGLRDYIKPGTTRGPDASKLITPRMLGFTPTGSQPTD